MKKLFLMAIATLFVFASGVGVNSKNNNSHRNSNIRKVAAPDGTVVTYSGFNNGQNGNGDIISGSLENLIDGDYDTSCQFPKPAVGDYIQLELPSAMEIRDIRVQYALEDAKDYLRRAYIKYSTDGIEFNTLDQMSMPNSATRSTVIDLRSYPITAKYVRLEVVQVIGWVHISDFLVNTLGSDTPIMSVKGFKIAASESLNGEWEYQLQNVFDGDDSTYCRFSRPAVGDYIQLEFDTPKEIRDIRIQYVLNEKSEYLRKAFVKYSTDGDTFVALDQMSMPNSATRSTVIDLRSYPITAKCLRLEVAQSDGWVNISEFSYNNLTADTPIVSIKGFKVATSEKLNDAWEYQVENIFDGDDSTYCRFSRPAVGDYIQIEFPEPIVVKDLRVKYVVNSTNEWLEYADFKYSLDGDTFIKIEEEKAHAEDRCAVVDLRNNPITAKCLRLEVSLVSGWVNICDFSYNNFTSSKPMISLSDNGKIYQGKLFYIIDGHDDTYCWFNGKPDYILLDYNKLTRIHDVRIISGKADDGDTMKGKLEYSVDNKTWTPVGEFSGTSTLFDLRTTPIAARYLRLVENGSAGWVSLKEVRINSLSDDYPTVEAIGNFVTASNESWNAPENMIDGDLETVMWYDWKFNQGSFFLLDLKKDTTIENIAFFQGGYTYANGVKRNNKDIIQIAKVYYSSDYDTWTPVGEVTYEQTFEIFVDLSDSPIEARYIKVESQQDQNKTGVVVREFAVNYQKSAPTIQFGTNTNLTYNGAPQCVDYSIPFNVNAEISFNKRNGSEILYETPTEPGWYSVVIKTEENAAYESYSGFKPFHILETADHFIELWESMFDANGEGICEYLNNDDGYLDELVFRFDNDLSEADRQKVQNHVYHVYQDGPTTIGETIDYIVEYKEYFKNKNSNNTDSRGVLSIKNISNSAGIILVSGLALASIITYSVILKKKKER